MRAGDAEPLGAAGTDRNRLCPHFCEEGCSGVGGEGGGSVRRCGVTLTGRKKTRWTPMLSFRIQKPRQEAVMFVCMSEGGERGFYRSFEKFPVEA